MGREERFPVWEAALGAGVAAVFAAGLVGVYLSMPDSDYSFLKLPRNLEELQILTYVSLPRCPFLVPVGALSVLFTKAFAVFRGLIS